MGMILLDTRKGGVNKVRIKVFGVGGGGCNAVDTMINQGMQKVTFVAVNTDIQSLSRNLAETKIQIGEQLTGGLGAGANPLIGRQAAEESMDLIHEAVSDVDICILIAGMGGGTGTGAAPVIANIARQQGKMVIAFVTTPFEFEGKQRSRNALTGLDELRAHANSLIIIPNDKLYDMITEDTSLWDAFKKVDMLLLEAVTSIARLITEPGLINLDFADVRAVMSIPGQAVITFGEGMGVHRSLNAVDAALSNVLIESKKLMGAKGLLVNVVGGKDLTLHEVTKCIRKLKSIVHEEANIIFGANVDPGYGEKVMVSIIATGIEEYMEDTHPMEISNKMPVKKEEIIIPKPIKDRVSETPVICDISYGDSFEEDLEIPTYIRRNKRYLGASFKDFE